MERGGGGPENRDNAGRFAKGRSGNPGGRAKVPEEAKRMLKAAASDAVRLLIETMQDEQAKTELRVRCAETVLDRVYGKAAQPIDGVVDNQIRIVMGGAEELSR